MKWGHRIFICFANMKSKWFTHHGHSWNTVHHGFRPRYFHGKLRGLHGISFGINFTEFHGAPVFSVEILRRIRGSVYNKTLKFHVNCMELLCSGPYDILWNMHIL